MRSREFPPVDNNCFATMLKGPDDAKKREEEETVMVNDFSDVLSKHCAGGKKEYDVAVFGLWGYNLVGFLIVRWRSFMLRIAALTPSCATFYSWMIEKMNTALDVALQQIATACPPGIYSMYYLKVYLSLFAQTNL